MPFKSRWNIDIPDLHLASLIFKSPTEPLSKDLRLFLDAERPDTHYLSPYEFRLWSQRFAAGLRKSGVQPGDRILLFSPNDLFFPVVFMGTIMAGAIFSGSNPSYIPRELAHQLKDSGAKYLLCSDATLDTGLAAAKLVGLGSDNIFVFNNQVYDGKGEGQKGCPYWGDLVASREEGSRFVWDDLSAPGAAVNTTLALNYSSGTTGVAKGVEITHKNYVSNACQLQHLWSIDPTYNDSSTRLMCFLPMYHALAQVYVVVSMLRSVPLYIMARFDFLKMLQNIQRFRITSLTAVPPVIVALAKHPAVKKFDLSSIRNVGSGAAPLSREVSQECEALWPEGVINIKQGWGMTEYGDLLSFCVYLKNSPSHWIFG
jgi:4-coumarate--CoA ligase